MRTRLYHWVTQHAAALDVFLLWILLTGLLVALAYGLGYPPHEELTRVLRYPFGYTDDLFTVEG